jgi:hypothetical protein
VDCLNFLLLPELPFRQGQNGATPVEASSNKIVDINKYRWKKHCRGLFELPIVA